LEDVFVPGYSSLGQVKASVVERLAFLPRELA
jgi:hypothetical protein